MKVKVYLHEIDNGEPPTMCFYSKEFGFLEYAHDAPVQHPLHFKNKKHMLINSYNHYKNPLKAAERWSLVTYLGDL